MYIWQMLDGVGPLVKLAQFTRWSLGFAVPAAVVSVGSGAYRVGPAASKRGLGIHSSGREHHDCLRHSLHVVVPPIHTGELQAPSMVNIKYKSLCVGIAM